MRKVGFWRSACAVVSIALAVTILDVAPALALVATPDAGVASVNGKVFTMVQSGNTLFIGGAFAKEIPTDGSPKVPAVLLGAINMTTGQPIASFSATVTDATTSPLVQTLAVSPDGSTLYVGGLFDAINGTPLNNLAAVSTATGAVNASFAPDVATTVNSLLVGPTGMVYFGGAFSHVNQQVRNHLAAVDAAGNLDPNWLPNANDNVRTMVFAEDGNTIFIGGKFTTMDGAARVDVARVTPDTGALNPWAIPVGTIKAPQQAWSLVPRGNRLFGGFGNHGNFLAAYRLDNGNSGDQLWRFSTTGNVEDLAVDAAGSEVFFGGHFGVGGDQKVCGNLELRAVGIADPATGAVDCTWLPQVEPHVSNQKGVKAMVLTGTQLWMGGFFTSISGVPVIGLARYTLASTGAPPTITSFSPAAGAAGTAVTISGSGFTDATDVRFNGVAAGLGNFIVNSDIQITATVPTGATTGPIAVQTPSGTGTSSSSFTVPTGSIPTVTSFTPESGSVGTTVTITGANFTGTTAVKFDGVQAMFAVDSDTQITATVPAGAASGKIAVKSPSGTGKSSTKFVVT